MPRTSVLSLHRILLTTRPRPNLLTPKPLHQQRTLTSTSSLLFPRKGSQDKDSIDRSSSEYSRSGTDDAAASEAQAAFDPNTTSPQAAKDIAGKGPGSGEETEGGNPLEVSPANPEVSKPKGHGQTAGAEKSKGEKSGTKTGAGGGRGGFGSPEKGGKRS
ncbi:hypothetical protein ACMFMF_002193 [Clarireedia jacksonii]